VRSRRHPGSRYPVCQSPHPKTGIPAFCARCFVLRSARASDRLTRNDSPPDRVSTGRYSPAFHRSITTMSFRSTARSAYLKVIPDNWRLAIVMSRSNMVCRVKSLWLFAGIAIYEPRPRHCQTVSPGHPHARGRVVK
jgi:hypothetical protein